MGEIISARFSRRGLLKGSLAVTAIAATVSPMALMLADEARAETGKSAFSFDEVEAGVDDTHHVAAGYDAEVLLRWGDPLFADALAFDPLAQSAAAQARQFGYNNDYVGFIPLDGSNEHGLLVVNHEYTNPHLMFAGLVSVVEKDGKKKLEQKTLSKEQVDIEIAAHGGTVVEIRKDGGKWQVVRDGKLNRRITADTPMEITGPAAGHDRLKTLADPTGTKVLGTDQQLRRRRDAVGHLRDGRGELPRLFLAASCRPAIAKRRTTSGSAFPAAPTSGPRITTASTIGKEPNEPNRFGWIVEVDVNDPTSTPKKRTALGRFKHEGAESRSWRRMAASSSISATTSGSTTSTSSSPRARSTRTTAPPT
jgi:secreted PhoX family phosphatase